MECRKNKENLNILVNKKHKVYNFHSISIEKKGMDICLLISKLSPSCLPKFGCFGIFMSIQLTYKKNLNTLN